MKKIREGKAEIFVPAESLTRKSPVFYNPDMRYQRDLTMCALRVFQKDMGRQLAICDPLAGTGVRSVRTALEVKGVGEIVVNDANPEAVKLIKKNIKENGLSDSGIDIQVTNKRANLLFLENRKRFDYIDIDPFGSPLNFIFNAGFALRTWPMGMLACTATDTGALCGSFPSTCFNRYGIKVLKTDFFKEMGARVLITVMMLELARHHLAFKPLYSHSNHYFRVLGRLRRSKSMMAAELKKIKFVFYCTSCLYRSLEMNHKCPQCGRKLHILGPLWTGKTHDPDFCKQMLADLRDTGYKETKELQTCINEIDEPFYYDMPRFFKVLKRGPKKIDEIMGNLQKEGYKTSRAHMSLTGVKTDAPYSKVAEAVKK